MNHFIRSSYINILSVRSSFVSGTEQARRKHTNNDRLVVESPVPQCLPARFIWYNSHRVGFTYELEYVTSDCAHSTCLDCVHCMVTNELCLLL